MKRKYTQNTKLLASLLACGCLIGGSAFSASAITVDDVAQKAREVGFPEEQVQLGYNYWATGNYTQADLEMAYAKLCEYDVQADEKVDSIFDTPVQTPTSPPATEPDRTGENSSASQDSSSSSSSGNASGGGSSSSSSSSTSSGGSASSTGSSSGTASGGTVTSTDFINMTLDEKIAYVNSMTPADKENFLNNLTPAERNSIIKQMNIDDQADLLQGYIDAAKGMNMNIAVDSISEQGIAVTIRDNEGTVVDKTAMGGVTIDETGISHTGLLACTSGAALLAIAGFAGLHRYLRRMDGQEE